MVKQLVQEWDQKSVRDRRPLDPITLTPRAGVLHRLHAPVYSTWKQSIKTLNYLKLKWEPCNIHLNQIIEMWSSQLCSFHLCFISSFFLTICAERERERCKNILQYIPATKLPANCRVSLWAARSRLTLLEVKRGRMMVRGPPPDPDDISSMLNVL